MKSINKNLKVIPETNEKYYVSSGGKIYKKENEDFFELKMHKDKNGYCKIDIRFEGLGRKKCLVHRIVAKVFIPNPMDYKEVNHIDGNKENNSVGNLEWCTRSQNILHAFANGLKVNKKGSASPHAVPVYQYTMDGKFVQKWGSIVEVTKYYNTWSGNVSYACNGKYKSCCGYIWSYDYEEKIDIEAHKKITKAVSVYQYDLENNFIKKFDSMEEAVIESGVDKSNIVKCCKGTRKSAGKYVWSYNSKKV